MIASRIALLIGLVAVPFAYASAQSAPGCGPANVKFDVKTNSKQHMAPAPASGKALAVFLQDDMNFDSRPRPSTRFGIDGTWVGATNANSFFYVPVDPGEHHLCADWQSRVSLLTPTRSTAAAEFAAQAGKVYYFRARDIGKAGNDEAVRAMELKLEPVDPDEAQLLMGKFAFSASQPKK